MTHTTAAGNAVLAATILVLFAGSFVVLRSALVSALVVFPLVLLAPWGSPAFASSGGDCFPLVLAFAWAFWMYLANGCEGKGARDVLTRPLPLSLLCLTCVAAMVASPQSWMVLGLIPVYELWKYGPKRGLRLAVAMLVVPVVFRLLIWVPAAIQVGSVTSASLWWEAWVAGDWTSAGYHQALSPAHVLEIQNGVDTLFWGPLVPAFVLAAVDFRRMTWFAPTMLWCALLMAGTFVIGRQEVFFHNTPLQMALLVPFGISAVLQLRRLPGVTGTMPEKA